MATSVEPIPTFNRLPGFLPRELKRHYISASEEEIQSMLQDLGLRQLSDLFDHIPQEVRFPRPPPLPRELEYGELADALREWSWENRLKTSFLGDGLPQFKVPEIVPYVCGIRNLTTSYTPYQPERSQGTLLTHWIYQCCMSELTKFEAVNSSLYDRSTAIFEAICAAIRMTRKSDSVIVSEGLFPGDREVIETLLQGTQLHVVWAPLDEASGRTDCAEIENIAKALGKRLAGIVFNQINHLGILEDVDRLTDTCHESGVKSIAVIDPMLLAQGGLKPPTRYGKRGADMIVGEGQHLGLAPNFGGPGLGLFGVRLNRKVKKDIRQSPGRYVGKAMDMSGRECRVMVLSTREQHIRKEKATSNICSNQAYVATIVGAAILQRGNEGMRKACQKARQNALHAFKGLSRLRSVSFPYRDALFYNEFIIEIPQPASQLIALGSRSADLHIGVDVTQRIKGRKGHFLKLSFSDLQTSEDVDRLVKFIGHSCGDDPAPEIEPAPLPQDQIRLVPLRLPEVRPDELMSYYDSLGELNISPDDTCYPLGSCTMKYNPQINDWAASLPGFANTHPQAPIDDVQGNLRALYQIQEWFKAITGLAGVTTQPVAGAQGELVGLKLFQAYHESRGDSQRDVVLIPRSAHGTNFATATMAGYATKRVAGRSCGIVYLEADETGQIDMDGLRNYLSNQGQHVAAIMVTNPNTGGIFESNFKEMADLIHQVGGLVFMDGANMNAIAGRVDLAALGVDAAHNNLHKTWTIPHGGGGPGDAIVAVGEKLIDFLPGYRIEKIDDRYLPVKPKHSIGSFHRHWGNFAHKIRCLAYLHRLGQEGVRRISGVAVLAARYLHKHLGAHFPGLPAHSAGIPRMHEFILTLEESDFERLEKVGIPKAIAIPRIGKLFLDFGFHAPTVAFPEVYGLMFEPTESYSKDELDRFAEAVIKILRIIRKHPEILRQVPLFTPVDRVDEVAANRQLQLSEPLAQLPSIPTNRIPAPELHAHSIDEIYRRILAQATL